MTEELNLVSLRSRRARLSNAIGASGEFLLGIFAAFLGAGGVYCLFFGELERVGYLLFAVAGVALMILLWYHYDLKKVPVSQPARQLDDVLDYKLLARLKAPITPQNVWHAVSQLPEAQFIQSHLLMDAKYIEPQLSTSEQDMAAVWRQATALMQAHSSTALHAGTLATAIIMTSQATEAFLMSFKIRKEEANEVLGWCERTLGYLHQPKPTFGGIGRDWATGFTPTLEHFGEDISRSIELGGGYTRFCAHEDLIDGVVSSLSRGSGVALVGPDGTGKNALVHTLADQLLEGRAPGLKYYRVISLNASQILSYSGAKLETLMLTLFGEAVAAGNIILYLDDAQLFFGSGVGAFDMSQVLLPVLKARNVRIVAAFTPTDWQQLQAMRSALANSFSSIAVNEPSEQATYKVIEDDALIMEHRNKLLITYEAIREAYRLSGQYMQERAYPGKAISLLEQAMPYAEHQALTAATIQAAVEKTKGVKVSAAQAPEAEMLLQLEDRIHQRMINQTRAVGVVAAALRRGRAGVSNPKRPVGSFLFLGPTGVGKTELARSLAAVYFGDEQQMIRLDMSEYQQSSDVSRLLAAGGQNENSLLLAIRQQPFAVVLLDEIEKAHPSILNLLLQMLDEGQLTDDQGRPASFRSSIIIATSNAGAADIAQRVKEGQPLDEFERPLIDKLIAAGQFKPELVNRFDEVVLFRPLTEEELAQVANVMLDGVNKTLAPQQITVQLTPEALKQIVHQGYDPEFGARPMRRIIQKTVENAIAVKILRGEVQPGSTVTLDVKDLTAE
jgi:ATP-dependent Clp protease ATP-binding subunit ClpC